MRAELAVPATAPALREALLSWWESHGRHDIPWKLRPDGHRPRDGEALDAYGILVAEVIRGYHE
jgi:A/G-specific adenine glycosylase